MKIKQTVFIHYQKYPWQEKGGFVVLSLPLNNDATHTMICQQEIELEIPDEFSPYEQHIATLIEEKKRPMQNTQKLLQRQTMKSTH